MATDGTLHGTPKNGETLQKVADFHRVSINELKRVPISISARRYTIALAKV